MQIINIILMRSQISSYKKELISSKNLWIFLIIFFFLFIIYQIDTKHVYILSASDFFICFYTYTSWRPTILGVKAIPRYTVLISYVYPYTFETCCKKLSHLNTYLFFVNKYIFLQEIIEKIFSYHFSHYFLINYKGKKIYIFNF